MPNAKVTTLDTPDVARLERLTRLDPDTWLDNCHLPHPSRQPQGKVEDYTNVNDVLETKHCEAN